MNNDLVNGLFEFLAGILMWFNIIKIYKDKQVMGFYLPICLFYGLFSIWSVYYYPNLKQNFSFIGAIILASGNIIWLSFAFYYKYIDNSKKNR